MVNRQEEPEERPAKLDTLPACDFYMITRYLN